MSKNSGDTMKDLHDKHRDISINFEEPITSPGESINPKSEKELLVESIGKEVRSYRTITNLQTQLEEYKSQSIPISKLEEVVKDNQTTDKRGGVFTSYLGIVEDLQNLIDKHKKGKG